MNIKDLLNNENTVSTAMLFNSENASVKAIQILEGAKYKKHVSQVPALLICIIGNVVFENEKGIKETLQPGDYEWIDPLVRHWMTAVSDSQLILLK